MYRHVVLGIVLMATVLGCAKLPTTALPTSTAMQTPVRSTTEVLGFPPNDKPDPFFRDVLDDLPTNEQWVIDLCFEHPPDDQTVRAINVQAIDVQVKGWVAGPTKLDCWAVRVRLIPQFLASISQIDEIYRIVLIAPTAKANYLSKLDAIVQTQARYKANSAKLKVFVHVQKELTDTRIKELGDLGLVVMPKTWIPPLDSHNTGFYLAEMQVSNIALLAKQPDVVRITSAEKELKP